MNLKQLTLEELKDLMSHFRETGMGMLELRDGETRLCLEARASEMAPAPVVPAVPMSPAAVPAQPEPVSSERPQEPAGNVVKSPIVGTYYAAAAPDKPPFVQVGSRVRKGDILFIIESMKLMNEIQSEFDGEVTEILAENAQGVEYGQPILVIR